MRMQLLAKTHKLLAFLHRHHPEQPVKQRLPGHLTDKTNTKRKHTEREALARLSRLARWVLLAERGGVKFGMRLPGLEVPLGEGEIQRERCLKELALFQAADPGGAQP